MSEDQWIRMTICRPGYSARRPEPDIELEESDKKRRTK